MLALFPMKLLLIFLVSASMSVAHTHITQQQQIGSDILVICILGAVRQSQIMKAAWAVYILYTPRL